MQGQVSGMCSSGPGGVKYQSVISSSSFANGAYIGWLRGGTPALLSCHFCDCDSVGSDVGPMALMLGHLLKGSRSTLASL
jgi:hypothetical protein